MRKKINTINNEKTKKRRPIKQNENKRQPTNFQGSAQPAKMHIGAKRSEVRDIQSSDIQNIDVS